MHFFEINGKEHEVKLGFKAIKYLNSLHEGGAFEFIHKALSGDIETYIEVVFAGLFHTEEGYRKADVEEAVDKLIMDEKLDLDTINSTLYGVVSDHFFYQKTLNKMFKDNPEAKKELDNLMK